jgi:cyanophycin synthetase
MGQERVQKMKISDIQVLRGPNYWSINHKLIQFRLDIGKFEELPTDKIPGFYDRLKECLPGLHEHQCSEGKPGGFFERVQRGTWLGHVTEHIALELETMAGLNCNFGKTRSTGAPGVYFVAFAYEEENAAIYAANAAVRIALSLAEGMPCDVGRDVEVIRKIAFEGSLGPSTYAIVKAAERRNIPYFRIDEGSLVQLGHGSRLKLIEATIAETTSAIAVDMASDKFRTKKLLKGASLPVAEGMIIKEEEELAEAITSLGFPLVIKPNDGNQGKGVTVNITDNEGALAAFRKARQLSGKIVAERFYPGNDYRLLVVDYRFVAAAMRTPAMVTGNGISPIRELIDEVNSDPLRGTDHENILTKIKIDESTLEMLRYQDLSLDSVPPKGKKIILKQTANLSTGGTSEDVTDIVHPDIIMVAERAARVTGLNICGIDFVSNDVSKPLKNCNGVIIEVNAAPGFRMHTHPQAGKPRPVAEAVVDMLFPGNNNGRVPIIAVTGTNGKTTTTRLIAHIVALAGFNVGYTTTEGIYLNHNLIEEGDCTGPDSAEKLLRDRNMNFAVLECARGGMLRSGLAFDRCDVGVVTNVAEDHIGLRGINSLEEMAKVKSIVPEAVREDGFAILNADDDSTYNMHFRLKCNVALFSTRPGNKRISDHCRNGGLAALYSNGELRLVRGEQTILSINENDIPVAYGGKALFMIENILAATLAVYSMKVNTGIIKQALLSFIPSYENNPGRMNIIELANFTFLLDYAHNFHGISALGSFIEKHPATNKIGIVSTAGDRRDIDIYNVGRASAKIFTRIIIRVDRDTRGRDENEIIDLILTGITAVNRNLPVSIIKNELEAVSYTLMNALPGSLIVLFAEKVRESYELINRFRQMEINKRMVLTEADGR